MGISQMKDEIHARLWQAQQRWFSLKDQGLTKHDLKMQGIREHGDMFHATRAIIFTGATSFLCTGMRLRVRTWLPEAHARYETPR